LKPGKSGEIAIVPGKPSESEFIRRITTTDEDDVMPPPKMKKTLSPSQIELFKRWIAEGANYEEHWAFKPPVRPPVPRVQGPRSKVQSPIDAFILDRLAKEKLKPSPEADKATLLRRLHLDLIGLPPTVEQLDAFLADKRPDAYARKVEELLASPHYGERWGRHWLDAARYADSDGFEKDKARFIWFYRDWVVNAFNRDLPYDQFIIEQLAGDLLLGATQDQIVATGFLRNSMINEEGGVDPEQFRMEAMFDRMDAVGKAVLGLTIQCAQCHTHKYDPLTQEEYYRMFAFLNNDHEGTRPVFTGEQLEKIASLRREMKEIEAGLQERHADWRERMAKWEESAKRNQPEWQVLALRNAGDNAQRYQYLPDGSLLAGGYAPTKWTSVFHATNHLPRITAFRLEQLPHPDLPSGGPGRSIKGLAALSEFMVEAVDAANPTNKVRVKFVKATADFAHAERELEDEFNDKSDKKRIYGPVAFAIDGKAETAWGIDAGPGRRNVARQAVFVAEKPVEFPQGAVLTVRLQQNHGGWNSDDNQNHNLGRFRVSVTGAPDAVADPIPPSVREILNVPREQRTPAQVAAVFSHWRTTVPEFKAANERIEALWAEHPEGHTTLTLQPRAEPRMTALLKRGDWLKPEKPVSMGVPAFLNPLPKNADNSRLTFARWLVDRNAPTTARVFVNRVWQAYFGTGLVETPEDFGLQSPLPSHPELLDWLAVEFMEPGSSGVLAAGFAASAKPWSVKHLHRLIVNSTTYKQSSRVTPEMLERDPSNRLLARGPRVRVEGEIVRDIALSVSGLLNAKIGGPSVFTPAPEFLFKPPASYGPFNWVDEIGPDRYRRALYTFRRRSTPYPALNAFDVPNGDFACVRRTRSNTPLQALTTLNETLFVESAQSLAQRILESGGKSDAERITYAFRRVVNRPPTKEEQAELLGLLQRASRRIADGWVNPNELATGKADKPTSLPAGATPAQLGAYTAVARVLLNLDETITKE